MTPRISALSLRFDTLPLDYRIVPTHDGFALQYREPCRFTWQDVCECESVEQCLGAYEHLCDTGEAPA